MINLDSTPDVQADSDVVGGSSYIKPSNIYPAAIDMCYYGESDSGAAFLDFKFKLGNGKGFYSERIYFSTGKAKGQVTYYEREGVKHNLPGYTTCYNLVLAAAKKEFKAVIQAAEAKEIMIYDRAQGKEVATKIDTVITGVIGKPVMIAIKEYLEPRGVKTQDSNGKTVYADSSNETRSTNQIASVFMEDKRTVNEAKEKAEIPKHYGEWLEGWEGKVQTVKPKEKYGLEPIESKDGKSLDEVAAAGAAFGGEAAEVGGGTEGEDTVFG